MALRPWQLVLAVVSLVSASAICFVRRDPAREAELAAAFAAEAAPTTVESPRVAPQFEREVPPVANAVEAPKLEVTLTPLERTSEVALDQVFGEVTDSYGVPLAGARVSLRAWRGSLGAELGVAQADESGRYRIDVSSWPSELAIRRVLRRRAQEQGSSPLELVTLGAVHLRLSADLVGYGTVLEERTVAEVLDQALRVDFRLPQGRAISGRVERDRSPRHLNAEATEVMLVDSLGNIAAQALTDARGEYTLYVPDGIYDLFARQRTRGTAFLPEVIVDRSNANELPTLQLVGSHRMQGKVTYPDGSPVASLVIEAEHESIAPQTYDGLTVRERIELERSEGLAQSVTRTDLKGLFEFPALRSGNFRLRLPDCDAALLTGDTLQGASSLAANFVFRGRRLRVDVLDQDGSAARDAQIDCWRVERGSEPSPEQEVVAHAAGFGTFFLHVEAGERLFLRAFEEGAPYAWRLLEVSPLGYEDTLRMVLHDGPQPAPLASSDLLQELGFQLTLEVLGEDGTPVTNWIASAATDWHEVPAGWRSARPARDGSLPPLPPGKFRIALAPADFSSFHCFDAVSAQVESTIGGARTLQLKVPTGGRLRFRAPPDATDKDAARGFTTAQDLELRGWKAEAFPAGSSHLSIPLHLVPTDPSQRASNRALPEAEVETYPTLLPGRYELRLSRPGSESRSIQVTVRAGKVTSVEP